MRFHSISSVLLLGLHLVQCVESDIGRRWLSSEQHIDHNRGSRQWARKIVSTSDQQGRLTPDNWVETRKTIDLTQDLYPGEVRRLVERYNKSRMTSEILNQDQGTPPHNDESSTPRTLRANPMPLSKGDGNSLVADESRRILQLPAQPTICGCSVKATFPFVADLLGLDSTEEAGVECTCKVCPGGGIIVGCSFSGVSVIDTVECPGETIETITSIMGDGTLIQPRIPDFLYRLTESFVGK